MAKKKKETTFKDILDIFIPKFWIILLVGVLCAGIVGVYSFFIKDRTYTASAEIYVYRSGTTDVSTSDIAAAEEMVNIYTRAIMGGKFIDRIKDDMADIGYNLSASDIKSLIKIDKVADTPNFIISVTSANVDLASDLAKTVVDGISTHIDGDIITNTLSSDVFEEPKPAEKISPNARHTVRNALIAFLIGIVLAAIGVWIHSAFDIVIRSSKKIEDNFDIPILGVIPNHEIAGVKEEGK